MKGRASVRNKNRVGFGARGMLGSGLGIRLGLVWSRACYDVLWHVQNTKKH